MLMIRKRVQDIIDESKNVNPEFVKFEKDLTRILVKVTKVDLSRLEKKLFEDSDDEESYIDSDEEGSKKDEKKNLDQDPKNGKLTDNEQESDSEEEGLFS